MLFVFIFIAVCYTLLALSVTWHVYRLLIASPTGAVAKYYDEYVCLCVYLCVCEDVCRTTHAIFTKFFVHIACVCGSDARSSSDMFMIGCITCRREIELDVDCIELCRLTLRCFDGVVFYFSNVTSSFSTTHASEFSITFYGVADAVIIFLPCGFFFYLLLLFPRLIPAVADWMSTILHDMVWT